MLLTRIEHFPDYSEDKVECSAAGGGTNHAGLFRAAGAAPRKSNRKCSTASRWISAATSQYGMSVEELLSDQRSRPDYSPALLEKIFEMGRHWFILTSGKYPSIAGRGQLHHQSANARFGTGGPPPWRRNPTGGPRPSANGRRGAGRPPRKRGSLFQLDRKPGRRTAGPTPKISSVFAARRFRSGRNKEWASNIITPAAPRLAACGPTGFPPGAWPTARSGTITWPPATRNFSASASCRLTKNWRCFTRIS